MRALVLALLCLHLVGAVGQPDSPAANVDHLEYRVKAAFLYNFARFVEWPNNPSNTSLPTLVIGVLGEDPFGPAFPS